jgi:hypothetical protein
MPKSLTVNQRERLERIVKEQVSSTGYVHINELCRQENISNSPIYKILDELGIERQKIFKKIPNSQPMLLRDEFRCTGIGKECAHCRRIFQYPCPMAKE